MLTDSLVTFFLPAYLRADNTHPRYTEFYVVANACILGLALLLVGAGVMRYVHQIVQQATEHWVADAAVAALVTCAGPTVVGGVGGACDITLLTVGGTGGRRAYLE